MDKIKIAILGSGGIARAMAKAMQCVPDAEIYCVASRSFDNATAFAKDFNVPHVYTFDEAIADPIPDLYYVALPHVQHYEYAKRCLIKGKNVLCEKPLCINSRLAEELFEIAKEKGVFFADNMWTRFLPAVNIVKNLIADGTIGEVKHMSAAIADSWLTSSMMTDPEQAGGMLLDCGIYALTCVDLLLGRDISDIQTSACLSDRGVDLHSITSLTFSDKKTASIYVSMDSLFPGKIAVAGENGYIEFTCAYNWKNLITYGKSDRTPHEVEIPEQKAGGYEYIVAAVCEAIRSGKTFCEQSTPEDTLYILRQMDMLREKWGLKYPIE